MLASFTLHDFLHPLEGLGYQFWSGVGSDFGELTLVTALVIFLFHRNCHEPRCWRLSWHPDGTGHPVCKRHHLEHPSEGVVRNILKRLGLRAPTAGPVRFHYRRKATDFPSGTSRFAHENDPLEGGCLMFPVNRVVALLTPVFSAVAGVGSAWLLKHFPGVPVPSAGELLAIEVTGATAAGGAALSWLKGHQAYEKRLDEGLIVAKKIETDATKADPGLVSYLEQLVESKVKELTNDNPTPDLTGLPVETDKPAVADNSALAPQYAGATPPAASPAPAQATGA